MRSSRRQRTKTVRKDIQGLRALAVLLVFANHIVGWPTGGFGGVDVFFVISGFLITGLLLREYERTGKISPRKFYLGRLKRIVPSATVVLLFVIGFSWALFTKTRAVSVTWDAFWAFVFGSNWNYAIAGTDYFNQDAAVSPLQHYWSLSVEEQFYFVWPWLLLGLLVVFARFITVDGRRARQIAATTISIIVVASFAWAMFSGATQPTVAYFSTFTRAWELGIGALVAIAAPLLTNIPGIARTVLAYVGLAGIIASCVLIPTTAAWPAPWALLPVLATAVVIASGVGEEARYVQPLTNRVSVYIGDISYSLYLWHFPAIIFGHALYPQAGSLAYLGIVLAGFALATAQYYAIERPIWKSPFGMAPRPGAWKQWWREHSLAVQYGLVGGFVTLSVAVVGVVFVPTPAPVEAPSAVATAESAPAVADAAPAVTAAAEAIRAALSLTAWPELTPSINEVGPQSKVDAWVKDGCLALEKGAERDPGETMRRCVYGPTGGDRIALVGDSVAISWLPALQTAYPDAEIHVMTMQQCPFALISVKKGDGSAFSECDSFHASVNSALTELKPALTVMSQAENSDRRLVGTVQMVDGLDAAIGAAKAASAQVVVLPPPPMGANISDCYSAQGQPGDCVVKAKPARATFVSELEQASERAGALFVDTDSLFCASGLCPAVAAGFVVRADPTHMTQQYSARLGSAVMELVRLGN